MTPRAFLPAISLTLLLGAGCPDDFAPESFEECNEELQELISAELYGPSAGMLHRHRSDETIPDKPGLWRLDRARELPVAHIALLEPERLPEVRAFNTYNDLFGGLWNDYDAQAYEMTLMPEDVRVACAGRYWGVSLKIYGTQEDALDRERTAADLILIDYTPFVEKYRRCKEQP